MTREQTAEVVKSALDRPRGERAAFLDQICGSDAKLRAGVESYLRFEDQSEQFIEQGALHIAAEASARAAGFGLPRRIEQYEIVSRIGVGGMGEVYLAQDTKLRRKVALKLVRAGMDSAELVARFRHEERILAGLNHPNIAQLYGAGVTRDDVPFFAMEHVDGVRIDNYCKAQALTTGARLQLFRKVCAAVHYAHQRLIIHRDLKPSNILVTAEGEPKLLDFGIAKLIEGQDAFTQIQTLPGAMTPDYASPEQVRGEDMTTASDVYSLGVLLYEILTGQRPYRLKTRTAAEVARAVTDQIPERPSTAVLHHSENQQSTIRNPQSLRGDLDNIVLMALRKEADRRYPSVEQFSEDIRRHLQGLPVRAHRDTFGYRASKFVRRHKAGVLATALVLAALLSGMVVTLRAQYRAERRFNDVRQLANALLTEIAPKIERLEGSTEARQALVTQSLRYIDSLAAESADDLTLQAELATAYEKVGVLQGDSRKPSLNDYRGAIASLEKAQQIRRRLLKIDPKDPENRRLLADNLRLLAIRRMARDDAEGGSRDGDEAVQIYTTLLTEQPGSRDLQRASLEAQLENAAGYMSLTRFGEAIPRLEQTAAKLEALRSATGEDKETERILAQCLASLGLSLSWNARQPEAETATARAVSLAESLVARFPHETNLKQDLWRVYDSAASIYEEIDDARGFELSGKSRRVAEEIITGDPANAQARRYLSKSFSRLGISAANLGRPDEAVGFLERALAILTELQEKDPLNREYDRDLRVLYVRLGVTHTKQRDFPAALTAFEKSAAFFEKQLAADAANTILLTDAASAYRHAGLTHKEVAATSDMAARQRHLAAAKDNYQRALNALLKAEAAKALPESSRTLVDALRRDLSELASPL
jgi:non-specific serine/threonine protein kinase/serine/threonine-protein kinase